MKHDALCRVERLRSGLFFYSILLKSIQAFEHIWLDKDGLHPHLELLTPIDLVNVPEVLDRLRIQLCQSFQKGLVTLIFFLLNFFFKFEDPLVKVDWHFELASLVASWGLVLVLIFLVVVVLLSTRTLARGLTLALLLASCLRLLVLLRGVVHVEVCERKVHQRSNASL